MNKALIQTRFAKTIASYNENAKIQKLMAEKLITLAQKESYENILEIGCGTGFLTKLAVNKFNYKNYRAIDIVKESASYINEIDSNILFTPEDIEEYLNCNNEKYDLIISNASLQWVSNFEEVINTLKKRLNNGGELIFSTFGKENFKEIKQILGTGLKYYSSVELENMFEGKSSEEILQMEFETPKDVLNHIKLTGVNAIEQRSWTKKDLQKFEDDYIKICTSKPTLTYHPVYFRYILCPIG